jgi:hypothetical protein
LLERDPEFEKSLLEKAKKQQDLVVMSYGSNKKTQVLYEPKADYEINRIEVMVDESKMNNNAALGMFIGKGLGGFDGGFAVAVLNDNVASIVAKIFF